MIYTCIIPCYNSEKTIFEVVKLLKNYFEENNVRYSHTIDPKTARPINHNLVSITVIADNCMSADGFSTGLNVLGPERGLEVANAQNIPVFMIVKTEKGFEERYSEAFKPYLQQK